MKRVTRQRSLWLWRTVRLLLVMCIISSTQQGVAESTVDTSTEQKMKRALHESDELTQRVETAQKFATLYYTPNPKDQNQKEPEKEAEEPIFVQVIKKIQLILIGGILLIIGTFFIPSLIPKFTGHKGLKPFSGTIITDTTFRKTQEHVVMPEDKDGSVEYYTIRCDSIVSPDFRFPVSIPSTIGMVRKFFQQSGFAFTEISDTELRVNSPLSHYKSYGEISVYILSDTPLNKSCIQQLYDKVRVRDYLTSTRHPYEKIAFAVVNTPLEDSVYHQIYSYRVKYNFTIIPLSHPFVMKSVRYSSCAQELEEKVNASTRQCNLYAMNTPVADPLSFFGRDDDMKQLLDVINHQEHIGLFGLPKIGKTWLVWQVKERLSHHIAAYVDLQHLPGTCSYLYRKIINECVRDAAFKYPDLELPALRLTRVNYTEDDRDDFMEDIVRLWKHLSVKQKDIKIIFLIDGAEQLVPGDSNDNDFPDFHEFLEAIRSISQQYGFLVSIMISTNSEVSEIDPCKTLNNPEEFHPYKKIFLSFLPEDVCNRMINAIGAQMGLIYTEESLSRIYYETSGHPYVTRQLCSLIAKNLKLLNAESWNLDVEEPTTVQVRDVEEAVSEYIEYKSEYLEGIWRQLSRVEQKILLTIAAKDSCTFDDLDLVKEEESYQVRRDCEQAISMLLEKSLIERCEDKYSITMGLFERIVPTGNQGSGQYSVVNRVFRT